MQENQVGADLFRTDVKTTSKDISGFALDEFYFLMCEKQISPQLLGEARPGEKAHPSHKVDLRRSPRGRVRPKRNQQNEDYHYYKISTVWSEDFIIDTWMNFGYSLFHFIFGVHHQSSAFNKAQVLLWLLDSGNCIFLCFRLLRLWLLCLQSLC